VREENPMRKIPETITDPAVIAKLTAISQQVEAKMKQVNLLRDQMKKKDMSPALLADLKKVSTEIDTLDQEWKALAES